MYCPDCNQDFDGKFCPECGTRLVERVQSQHEDVGLSIGDGNAINGSVNITRTTTHTTNIVERSKSAMELNSERESRYIEHCKRCLDDFVITNDELASLEALRIELGLNRERADELLESVRQLVMNSARRTTLVGVSKIRAKQFSDAIANNNIDAVRQLLMGIEAIVEANENDELHYKYFMALAAIDPEYSITLYEKSLNDNYWLSFWSYISYLKQKNVIASEKVLVDLDVKFVDSPSDNAVILAAAGAVLSHNVDVVNEYMTALEGNYSPLLQRLVDAINSVVGKADVVAGCEFYVEHLLAVDSAEKRAKEEALRLESERKAAEAEAKREAKRLETERKAAEAEAKREAKRLAVDKIEAARRVAAADKRVVYSEDYTTLLRVKKEYKASLKTFEVPSCVKSIGEYAFSETAIESIDIPEGVVEIGRAAFLKADKLKRVQLPTTLKSIGEFAFSETAIESIDIPEGVVELGRCVFYKSGKLKRVQLPTTLKSIGEAAFRETAIESIDIPKGVVELGGRVFLESGKLKRVQLPTTLKSIGEYAFRETAIESIDIPDGVVEIGKNIFYQAGKLKRVQLPTTLKSIGEFAFSETAIESIDIPEGVVELGRCVFLKSGKLKRVQLPSTLKSIGEYTFSKTAIESIDIPEGVVELGRNVFFKASKLKRVQLPSTLKSIGEYAFRETAIESIVIPDGVVTVDNFAFTDCANLKSILFPGSIKELYMGVISDCCNLKDVYLCGLPKKLYPTKYTIHPFNLYLIDIEMSKNAVAIVEAIKDSIKCLYVSMLYFDNYSAAFAKSRLTVKDVTQLFMYINPNATDDLALKEACRVHDRKYMPVFER